MILHKSTPNYVIYDDFFNEEELSKIWNEVLFLTSPSKMLPPEKSGSAIDNNGKILKKNSAIFLENIYADRLTSDINVLTDKVFSREIFDQLNLIGGVFNYIKVTNRNYNFLSYYEDSDYYRPHLDYSVFTMLIWLSKEPKKFEGGDLIFDDINETIDFKSNRLIIFPSFLFHSVTPVKMVGDYKPYGGNGRYTITKFLTVNPIKN